MPFLKLSEIEKKELFPGFEGRFYHSANMTFVNWKIRKGALLPVHSHKHEQIVNMIEGEFELTIDNKTQILTADSVAVIPSHAEHSGRALADCRIIDVFYPLREDYL